MATRGKLLHFGLEKLIELDFKDLQNIFMLGMKSTDYTLCWLCGGKLNVGFMGLLVS